MKYTFLVDADFDERNCIAWRVEPGAPDPDGPIISPTGAWDTGLVFAHGTVMIDPIDKKWKMWNTSAEFGRGHDENLRLTYFESEDGVNWIRPELDICPYPGHDKTNILLGFESGGKSFFASVLVHPSASEERRYEMFVLRNPELFPGERVAGFEGAVGLAARAVYRYWSSDGLHWQPGDGPLLGWDKRGHLSDKGTSDGCYVYLDDDGTYVMHQKLYVGRLPGSVVPYDCGTHEGTRTIWRRTSIDGVNWSRPQLIMQADWRDPQDTQFMELTRHSLPGGYVGIATTYHTLNQTIDLQFSGSRDGVQWWRPIPRVPCVGLAPLGDLGSGMLWSFGQFVEHAGRLYLYYAGLNGIHGDIYSLTPGLHPFHGALFRVSWLPDRLWAIVPASGGAGSVRTEAQDIEGRTLEVNAYVPEDGELRVELLKDDGTPIAGYTADDCQLISGDVHDAPVRWRGGVQAPVGAKRARFMLQRARLYGFGWS